MSLPRVPDHSVSGDGDVTLFLLHGAYGAKDYWRDTTEVLCRAGYRVVAWDAPGYGISPLPAGLTIDYCAQALEALVRTVGKGRTVLLGHSMGGLVAQRFCDLHPGAVHGLVLSATVSSVLDNDREWLMDFLRRRVQPIVEGKSVAEYAPGLLREMMGPGASGPTVELIIDTVKRMRTETFSAAIEAIKGYDGRDIPPRLRQPTLLISGELDGTCRASVMERMHGLIEGSEYHCISGVGHYGFAERPEEYHGVLLDFLSRRLPG